VKAENRQSSSCTDEVDRELLKRFQGGDETAFEELLEIHFNYFKKWARRVLDKAPRANWDDIVQEAHIGFYLAAKKFDLARKSSFHVLARKYARRMFDSREVRVVKRNQQHNFTEVTAANDRWREKSDRPPTLKELSVEAKLTVRQVKTALNVVDVFPFPLEEAEGVLGNEDPYKTQLLSDVLGQLSPEYADVIILHDVDGQTYGEIAKTMGKSEEAVKKLHTRALKKSRGIIRGKEKRKDGT
jgi:RNA polymerase sigma factor (sigma-70 family)